MPAKTSSVTGVCSISTKTAAVSAMKATVSRLRVRSEVRDVVRNDTEVYAAPMTEVSAAAHRITPKTRRPDLAGRGLERGAGRVVGRQAGTARDDAEDRQEEQGPHHAGDQDRRPPSCG